MRAVLSGFAALALVGAAQISNAANVIRIGVNKIEFKWTGASGSPDGYLVSRSNKGGPMQAFAWVTKPRVEMPVVPGDQITISVAPGRGTAPERCSWARHPFNRIASGWSPRRRSHRWRVPAAVLGVSVDTAAIALQCVARARRGARDAQHWKMLGRAALDDAERRDGLAQRDDRADLRLGPLRSRDDPGQHRLGGARTYKGVGPADFDRNGIQELVTQRLDTGAVVCSGSRRRA